MTLGHAGERAQPLQLGGAIGCALWWWPKGLCRMCWPCVWPSSAATVWRTGHGQPRERKTREVGCEFTASRNDVSHQALHADVVLALLVLVDVEHLQPAFACARNHIPCMDLGAWFADGPPVESHITPLDQIRHLGASEAEAFRGEGRHDVHTSREQQQWHIAGWCPHSAPQSKITV